MKFVLALDQGTTSSRAILFDESGASVHSSQREFRQHYPESGWVEHDPAEIWETQRATMEEVISRTETGSIAGIGITNQRETTVVWDAESGEAIYNAIVWQDRRTAERCAALKEQGLEKGVSEKTGLRIDPYFSATKVAWILDHVEGAREMAVAGRLRFGTIDSWLVWKLTGGTVHVTDVSNASRTNLLNIHTLAWDEELLEIFGVPRSMLPEVVDSSGVVGEWEGIPIAGMAGDQQAALFGQACLESGMAKNTYGTGCFLLMNTGREAVASRSGLLTTVAWRLGGEVTYALEGSVFIGGALFQWLRDELQLVASASEVDELAATVPDSGGCVLVPAFAGLGAPHWDPFARGAMFGVTRGTSKAHLCRAALEAVALQSVELLECMEKDAGVELVELRVDGGAARSDLLMQMQSDFLNRRVVRPTRIETTAFGAAALAGLATGVWKNCEEFSARWGVDQRFEPSGVDTSAVRARWDRAVGRCKGWEEG
ncbi:MAG: glycerol kinase GlpK [Roseibacillus sp.]